MFFGGGGDPFEHFHHGGMGGGGRGGRGGRGGGPASKDVDTTKLYESLGVSISCHLFDRNYMKWHSSII